MTFRGQGFRLTKHGRARYIERYGSRSDYEIIVDCLTILSHRAVWAPDSRLPKGHYRLVTVLPAGSKRVIKPCYLT